MKKTVLIAALLACVFGAFAQTNTHAAQSDNSSDGKGFSQLVTRMQELAGAPQTAASQPAPTKSATTQAAAPPAQPKTIILLKKPPVTPNKPTLNSPTASGSTSAKGKEQTEVALKSPLAILPTKVRAQALPGLGVMPGDASDFKIKSVAVGTDRITLVWIAQSQLNKISTPFESPEAIDATGATIKAVGQDIYFQPTSDKPLTIYITDGGVGQSIGLTLVPKMNLPAQTIVIQPDATVNSARAKAETDEIVASDYVSRINSTIKQLALGSTPAGYTRSRLPRSVATNDELLIEPQYKYAGSTYNLFSYKVKSTSLSPLEMKEESFYADSVRAVAFFPSAMLQQGEETMVYVIADRALKGQE